MCYSLYETFHFYEAEGKYSNIFFNLSSKIPNKTFFAQNLKFFTPHEIFIFKQFMLLNLNLTLIHIQTATFKLGVLVLMTK